MIIKIKLYFEKNIDIKNAKLFKILFLIKIKTYHWILNLQHLINQVRNTPQ